MPDQHTIDEAIAEDKARENRKGKRGRPKGEPRRSTSVQLPADLKAIPHGEKLKKIEAWIDARNFNKLIKNAMTATMKHYQKYGTYRPFAFRYHPATHDLKNAAGDADKTREMKSTIMIPQSLETKIESAASKLGCRQSDVIRMALADYYNDDGESGLTLRDDYIQPGKSLAMS